MSEYHPYVIADNLDKAKARIVELEAEVEELKAQLDAEGSIKDLLDTTDMRTTRATTAARLRTWLPPYR